MRILNNMSRMHLMVLASILFHCAVILGIKFESPTLRMLKDNLKTLDIILVNAKSKSSPEKADALAQVNLNRGGNSDEKRRMKSALPVPKNVPKETVAQPVSESQKLAAKVEKMDKVATEQNKQIVDLEQRIQQAITQLQATKKIEQTMATVTTVDPSIQASELMAQSLEAMRLEAEIAKQQEAYQKRPVRKFIGARAREYRFATYVEAWRQKVEKIGNLNYPAAARERRLYGNLRMTVAIKADGSVEYIEINQSSGHKILDDAARRIVQMSAPFARFPDNIRKDTDIIEIVRTWSFTREDALATDF